MDFSLPAFSAHGDSPGKDTRVGFHALLQGIFPTQGSHLYSLCLLHCRQIFFFFFLPLSHWGSPIIALLPCKKDSFIRFSKECKSFWNFLYSPLNLLKFSQRRNRISFEDRIKSEPWRRSQMCVGLNWAPTSGISGAVSDGQQRLKGDSGFLGLLKPCLQMAVYT